ncbi:MAG TPA: thiamine pyrophosphate-binding protein [Gemmatimonadales bacterium]|nr:thiamine pyrophosphate-binding protein [Gemmatimonadales bacterium]
MKLTGGEIVARALADEGVRFAFGIPGTHNIELYDALAESDAVRAVLVTDEQSASFMADGVWRASGQLGCVNVVPGAGLTHALSGIAEAFMDTVPLLVLGCGIRQDFKKSFQLHDVDQLAIAAPITKAAFRVDRGADLYPEIRRACLIARSGAPGPVMVEVPVNLYLQRHDVDPAGWSAPAPVAPPVPEAEDIDQAVRLLDGDAVRPLLYLGLGAAGAGVDLVALAERLQAPVATTFQGKGVFPESHPLFLWNGFGDAAPPFVREVARGRNATLAIGCRFSEVGTGSYGVAPPRPLIHVDIEPAVLGRNFPTDLGLEADAGAFVRALLPSLRSRAPEPEVRAAIRAGHDATWKQWLADVGAGPKVTPAHLLRSLQSAFGPDTIFTTDSGNGTFLAMECLRLERPGQFLAPVDYSCMGYSVPAALGAKLARPECPVVALAGDGAFLMTGLELLTAANQGIAVAVFVLRDKELAQIAQFQETALNRKTASVLPDYDVGGIAAGLGVEALHLRSDAEVPRVLEQVRDCLGRGRPIVVDTAIDYSRKTFFTAGVVKTNLLRFSWPERLRFIGRALKRKVLG